MVHFEEKKYSRAKRVLTKEIRLFILNLLNSGEYRRFLCSKATVFYTALVDFSQIFEEIAHLDKECSKLDKNSTQDEVNTWLSDIVYEIERLRHVLKKLEDQTPFISYQLFNN